MFRKQSLRFKIIFSVAVYIMGIGIIGNVLLYRYLSNAVSQKSENLDMAYLEAVRSRIDGSLEDIFSLGMMCAGDPAVLQAVSRQERTGQEFIRDMLNAQDRINAFLLAKSINNINVLVLFDNKGLFVQGQCRFSGDISGTDAITSMPLFKRLTDEGLSWLGGPGPSIAPQFRRDAVALFVRVRGAYHNQAEGFLYIEAGLDMITGIFREFAVPPGVFMRAEETGEIVRQNEPRLVKPEPGSLGSMPENAAFPYRFRQGGRRYRLDRLPLEYTLALYNQADVSSLAPDDHYVLRTVLAMGIISLLSAIGLGMALSEYLTRPIHAIISRIRKISGENDFSYDPGIEKNGDEIGLIGRAINEMARNIGGFLIKMEEHYREQKNAEIALLQTQINPHFLYNTLDSIQWMAKLQNNPVIADTTRRLINLLRNIAARPDRGPVKITLSEELSILKDYTEIMSVRYMGSFEVVCRIPDAFMNCRVPRLTLQPLVENALLHGIEPSGRYGLITLDAAEAGAYLELSVKDSGAGMTQEQIDNIKTRKGQKDRNNPSLNNIGIVNVDERLKLLYGESCGLFFESQPGKYTTVTVRILKEL